MTSCILSSQYCIDYMCPANTVLIIWNIQTFICLVVVMHDFYLTPMLFGNMYSSYLNFWCDPRPRSLLDISNTSGLVEFSPEKMHV